jgi:hypothetical protein
MAPKRTWIFGGFSFYRLRQPHGARWTISKPVPMSECKSVVWVRLTEKAWTQGYPFESTSERIHSVDTTAKVGYYSQNFRVGDHMGRLWSIGLSLLVLSSVMGGADGGRPEPQVHILPLTRVVRIPLSAVGVQLPGENPPQDGASLLVQPGAEDELAVGPSGFDVLDSSLLISDPLRKSISVFDTQGKFRAAWKIGFAADSITVVSSELVLVREAVTGQYYAFDRNGKPRPSAGTALPLAPKAWIDKGSKSGSVALSGVMGGPSHTLQVQTDQPGTTLLSLEVLANGQGGGTYVALETTANDQSTDAVNLQKYVRKYSADGRVVCQTADIPLDYYVVPVDELRVHEGVIYQLMTTSSEVQINVWNTN